MSRPNIVLFMPDQLRADALGCFGSPVARTPHFDALAARGVRCTDAWSQHSVCGPSRVSMMTGWYPHVHGHRTLDNLLEPWEPNLLAILQSAGYHVAMVGTRGDVFAPGVTDASTDFSGYLVRPEPDAATRRLAGAPPEGSARYRAMWFGGSGDGVVVDSDEAAIRTAEQWLAEAAPSDQPWALWIPLLFPHPPFWVEEPWFSMHDRASMPDPIPPTPGKAGFMDAYRSIYGWDELTLDDFHEIAATYHGMVSRVDDQLGRVLRAVDTIGATDDTLVATFTDHGEYLGDFGLVEKWPSGLDPCLVRNPLILAGAGVAEGVSFDQPVEMIDLFATLCDVAEATVEHTHFGRSLLPALADDSVVHRAFACSEGGFRPGDVDLLERASWIYQPKGDLQHDRPDLVGTAIALRTPDHTYVLRRHERDEFYDRSVDPQEVDNRIDDPACAVRIEELRSHLLGWLADTSDVIPWTPNPRFPEVPHGYR